MKKEDFKHSILDRWDIDIEEKDNYRVHEEKYCLLVILAIINGSSY